MNLNDRLMEKGSAYLWILLFKCDWRATAVSQYLEHSTQYWSYISTPRSTSLRWPKLTCWPNPGLSSSIGCFSSLFLFWGRKSVSIWSRSFTRARVRAARCTSRRAWWVLHRDIRPTFRSHWRRCIPRHTWNVLIYPCWLVECWYDVKLERCSKK